MPLASAWPPALMGRLRLPSLRLAIGLMAALMVAIAILWLIDLKATVRYSSVPAVEGMVPSVTITRSEQVALFGLDSPVGAPPSLEGERPDIAGPPVDPDPALIEWHDGASLPRIADDGRRPLDVYARALSAPVGDRPMIAIVVTGLGLDSERLEQSTLLPGAVSLVHTPYAAHLGPWQRHARWHGHEVMLALGLQAADDPASDLGPWTLGPLDGEVEQLAGLERILARSEGFFGLAAESGMFGATPEGFAPIAASLAERGLGFVELGDTRLAAAATDQGLAYVSAVGPLDDVTEPDAIDAALGRLELAALSDGRAIGYVQPYPLTFDRLWHWAQTLEGKGIALVPVSHLLAEP